MRAMVPLLLLLAALASGAAAAPQLFAPVHFEQTIGNATLTVAVAAPTTLAYNITSPGGLRVASYPSIPVLFHCGGQYLALANGTLAITAATTSGPPPPVASNAAWDAPTATLQVDLTSTGAARLSPPATFSVFFVAHPTTFRFVQLFRSGCPGANVSALPSNSSCDVSKVQCHRPSTSPSCPHSISSSSHHLAIAR